MIELKEIDKSFAGRKVLSGFNLEVAYGEKVVISGRSGCGKSTLLRLIAGSRFPTRERYPSTVRWLLAIEPFSCRPKSGSSATYSRILPYGPT